MKRLYTSYFSQQYFISLSQANSLNYHVKKRHVLQENKQSNNFIVFSKCLGLRLTQPLFVREQNTPLHLRTTAWEES